VKFDEERSGIDAERTWTIAMRAKEGLAKAPESFAFAKPKVETATNEHFRYVDADLASVGETVTLERVYGKPSRMWLWWIPAAIVVVVGAFFGWKRMRKTEARSEGRFRVPEPVNPFTVLGLLREIETNNGLATGQKQDLAKEIAAIERHYFVEESGEAPNLRTIAESWVGRAR
jgi:hypothetical protein